MIAYLSDKRYKMVLTHGIDFDIFYNDKFVMIFVENCTIDNLAQVFFISFCEVEQCLCITIGCVQ
jgi:hypothetical protein